ncbi:hypothetical protein ANN_06364 [Periplaneta americana]|uniref:Uncharacterized protein n=1 Tax=Periplaneta americana TaxID=6978 RepID=A0ABQ8TDC3_PERAM|nr:hypothetical protein ANN_06364 [Periplaneta americana]
MPITPHHSSAEIKKAAPPPAPPPSVFMSLMLAGSEFQSLGRALVKEDEYEEVRWDVDTAAVLTLPYNANAKMAKDKDAMFFSKSAEYILCSLVLLSDTENRSEMCMNRSSSSKMLMGGRQEDAENRDEWRYIVNEAKNH